MYKKANSKLNFRFLQFLKFGLVGISNTFISYMLNIGTLFFLKPFHTSYDYVIANLVAFLLSVLWSYYWNSRFIFLQSGSASATTKTGTLLRTYISYSLTGILLNNVLSTFWIYVIHLSKYIAPLVNPIISVPINFLLNKFWAFRDTD